MQSGNDEGLSFVTKQRDMTDRKAKKEKHCAIASHIWTLQKLTVDRVAATRHKQVGGG